MCEPDVAHVLRLQRTIGNRATTRLLRSGGVLADVEQERARFEAAKRTHRQRLAHYPPSPHALRTRASPPTSRIDGRRAKYPEGDRGEQDRSPTSRASSRAPRHRGHVRGPSQRGGLQPGRHQLPAHHRRPADRDGARRGSTATSAASSTAVTTRSTSARARSSAMRFTRRCTRSPNPVFKPYWKRFINEGVTQYFTDVLLKEQGLSVVTDHEYQDELACAKKLVAATSFEVVASAYFLNDGRLRESARRGGSSSKRSRSRPRWTRRRSARACRAGCRRAPRRPRRRL